MSTFDTYGRPLVDKDYYDGEWRDNKYAYDESGKLIQVSYMGQGSGDGYTLDFYHDGQGNIAVAKNTDARTETYFTYDEHGNYTKVYEVDLSENPDPPFSIEYINKYENGLLVSKKEGEVITTFTYEGINLVMTEENSTDDKTGTVKTNSKLITNYFENGLVKEEIYESQFSEGIIKKSYAYEFY
ncbi:hypothetical protein BH10BAC5_BH10BAC5_25430 [soil metagenome]